MSTPNYKFVVIYLLYRVSIQTSTAYTWNCYYIIVISQYCDFDTEPLFIHFINSVFSRFQYGQCNTQTNLLGIYSFVLKLPEDGTMVLKHVGL